VCLNTGKANPIASEPAVCLFGGDTDLRAIFVQRR
jgi:hypothetical protein